LSFKELNRLIKSDFNFLKGNKTGFKNFIVTVFFNPKFQLIFNYRLSVYFEKSSFGFLNIIIYYINLIFFSSEISPKSKIGENFRVAHPIGIIIGHGVEIGNNVTIFQNVTIGGKNIGEEIYPLIGDNVTVFANATIVGAVRVSNYNVIGANSLVIHSCLDENSIYAGLPAKKISCV